MTKIALIAAIAENNAIGYENKLIYWLPNDLKRFKELTTGHTIIMGSNTFRSLPKGALPNRRNIVLSRKESHFPGAEHFTSLNEALSNCVDEEIVYIIGGEQLYKAALPLADILCLTEVKDTPEKSDATDCETVLEIFSASFVIRLIISPWRWLSIYLIGRCSILWKRSLRSFCTVLCERWAAIILCR